MKKKFILAPIICLSISMALISCNKGKGTGPEQPYGEKSGIITYKPMEMMGVKVTQTTYFDDYGRRESRETMVEGNMQGTQMRQHTIDIRDGKVMYHFELENIADGQNHAEKVAYKIDVTPEIFEQLNISGYSDKFKAKIKYKDEGQETVAGFTGNKYSSNPDESTPNSRMTTVHYKNIPLKVTVGQMEIVAEKISFGCSVPAEKFKVPDGYAIKEEPKEPMQQMHSENPDTTQGKK